jgi:NNP family nitrate/nitrite transporter-like MFS transporter
MNTYQADMAVFGSDFMNESNVKVITSYFGALCIFAGALLRPVRGAISDKIGGVKSLYIFFSSIVVLTFISAFIALPFWATILVMFLIMANLGMTNG